MLLVSLPKCAKFLFVFLDDMNNNAISSLIEDSFVLVEKFSSKNIIHISPFHNRLHKSSFVIPPDLLLKIQEAQSPLNSSNRECNDKANVSLFTELIEIIRGHILSVYAINISRHSVDRAYHIRLYVAGYDASPLLDHNADESTVSSDISTAIHPFEYIQQILLTDTLYFQIEGYIELLFVPPEEFDKPIIYRSISRSGFISLFMDKADLTLNNLHHNILVSTHYLCIEYFFVSISKSI